MFNQSSHRLLTALAVLVLAPALAGAKGCHFGEDAVPLGDDDPNGLAGSAPVGTGGTGGGPLDAGIGGTGTGGGPVAVDAGIGGTGTGGGPVAVDAGIGGAGGVCVLPPDPGPCDAAFPRYHFDAATGTCKEFIWGGCDGNGNNFVSLLECQAACTTSQVSAVVQASSCDGFGQQITSSQDTARFELSGNTLVGSQFWGCGCPTRPEFVMTYVPASPLQLRLCHDDSADSCEAGCSGPVSYDMSAAFAAAGTNEYVFVD